MVINKWWLKKSAPLSNSNLLVIGVSWLKYKLILVMIGIQTTIQLYIQYSITLLYRLPVLTIRFLLISWNCIWDQLKFFRGSEPLLETRYPASNAAGNTACARTLWLGAPPSTHPIGHLCTLRCTLDPSGIWQHFFFELGRDFDGLGRRSHFWDFEGHSCFLVGFIA